VIDSLRLLLYDDNVLVQKKLIVSMITIYRLTLKVRISMSKDLNDKILFVLVAFKISTF
jgi:hypothetical protein